MTIRLHGPATPRTAGRRSGSNNLARTGMPGAVVLLLLAALFCAPMVTATAAPAQPSASCSVSLRSDVDNLSAQARQLGANIKAHNDRGGSVDRTNAGAVAAYNAEADTLNAQKATLAPQIAAVATRIEACGGQVAAPQLPDSKGNIPPAGSPKSQVPPPPARQAAPPVVTAPRVAVPQPKIEPKSPQAPPVQIGSPAAQSDVPTAIERSRASIDQKVNDPEYQHRNFEKAGPNGELRRTSAPGTLDADGDVIPKISRDPAAPGRYRVTPDGAEVPAVFTDKNYYDGNPADTAAQTAVDGRARAIASGDNSRITKSGEALGEEAGRVSIARDFPSDEFDVTELTDPAKTGVRGEPDQVFRVVPRDGGPTRIIVIEAKSPYGNLGMRRGENGRTYQQGTRGYLNSLLGTMGTGSKELRAVAREVRGALDDGQLTYRLVQSRVPEGGRWSGYIVRDFDIR